MVRSARAKTNTTEPAAKDGFEERSARAVAELEKEMLDARRALRGIGDNPLPELDEDGNVPFTGEKPAKKERSAEERAKHPYNQCAFCGNLGQDAYMSYTPHGKCVVKLSLAVWQGEGKETMWIRVTLWEELAEMYGPELEKGDRVWVSGRLTFRTYIGSDGAKRSAYELVARECELD